DFLGVVMLEGERIARLAALELDWLDPREEFHGGCSVILIQASATVAIFFGASLMVTAFASIFGFSFSGLLSKSTSVAFLYFTPRAHVTRAVMTLVFGLKRRTSSPASVLRALVMTAPPVTSTNPDVAGMIALPRWMRKSGVRMYTSCSPAASCCARAKS